MRRSLTPARLRPMPRGWLALVLAAGPVAAFASCSSSSGGNGSIAIADGGPGDDGGDDGAVPTPPAWDQPVTRPDDPTASGGRAACQYKRGDMPAATLGPGIPIDADMPIDNIVVVMMENHSFDSYLGHLNKFANRTDIESAPDTASNPGTRSTPARSTRTTSGPARTRRSTTARWTAS
jgi:phospholipase C